MTSARKLEANRRNAQASTGPRTAAGKARAAQNARRHGLSLAALCNPSCSGEVETLARAIAGADAGLERLGLGARDRRRTDRRRACAARTPCALSRGARGRCARAPRGHRPLRAARLFAPQCRDPGLRFRGCDACRSSVPRTARRHFGRTKPTGSGRHSAERSQQGQADGLAERSQQRQVDGPAEQSQQRQVDGSAERKPNAALATTGERHQRRTVL